MGKWYLQASTFIFYWIFVKLAGNKDRHKILDNFEFGPDLISHFGVMKADHIVEMLLFFSDDLPANNPFRTQDQGEGTR